MLKAINFVLSLVVCLSFSNAFATAACAGPNGPLSAKTYGEANADFGSRIATSLYTSSPTTNLILPITAIHSVLTMAFLGTGEATSSRAELANALLLPKDEPSAQLLATYGQALKDLNADGNGVDAPKVKLLNALFVNPSTKLKPDFVSSLQLNFGAQITSATPAEVDKVNQAVKAATDGKIEKVLESLNPNMALVLLSASYVKAAWSKPMKVSQTRAAKFNPTGAVSAQSYDVQMMSSLSNYGFSETNDVQVVEMSLKGPELNNGDPRYSALLVVPKGKNTIESALKMTATELESILSVKRRGSVYLTVPKFEFKSKSNLVSPLQKMGVQAPFQAGDFSNLSDDYKNLYISQVQSSGFIEFNEAGLAGGGAAAVEISSRGIGPQPDHEVNVDRPFVLLVRDNLLAVNLLEAAVVHP